MEWAGFGQVSVGALLLLCAAAFLAGAVDAVVGGGGLIQLPALLLVAPGGLPIYSLATSKVASFFGTASAVPAYARRTEIEWRSAVPMAVMALLGSLAGAAFASVLPATVLNIIVWVALVGVGIYTWRKPDFGVRDLWRHSVRRRTAIMCAVGGLIGFWDGLAGPGTGSFLVFALVGLVGYAFLRASATAKVVNSATNIGALLLFALSGKVLWGLGLVMAVCNVTGSLLGARIAVSRGSAFIRRVFLTVVVTLLITLGWKIALS
ncbi:hypothetical protein KALB_1638 [Kutzneria albida DSM 43870]|uniref:Probable membrane transporter protein n=1 Tax=Kutzneria albida DSM 43870 TaxID=1449976 RepID=W5W2I5_9PSEU|nr:hypothetical protein KALB_1638 [Kutzneria albida DSM 43870]